MINKQIKFESVNISEALRYLGYGSNEPDPKIKELLSLCEKELLRVARPQYIYKVLELTDDLQLKGCTFKLEGNDIKKHLAGCSKAILMCATLSLEVDKLIRIKQIGDMAQATIIDSMASALVEQLCDKVEEQIKEDIPGYEYTWRYGLGYGDLPLAGQKEFLNVLDAPKKIGVCVNDSLMLVPTKSVTCIIGVGTKKSDIEKKNCINCNLYKDCIYRRKGEGCEH